jgi:hypothetical protein
MISTREFPALHIVPDLSYSESRVYDFSHSLQQDTRIVSSIFLLVALGYGLGGSNPGRGWEFSSSPLRPDRLWGPRSLLSSGYQGSFPGGEAAGAWSWPLTIMAWCSVKEKHRGNFTFTLLTFNGDLSNAQGL